jgi:hypothetical protein
MRVGAEPDDGQVQILALLLVVVCVSVTVVVWAVYFRIQFGESIAFGGTHPSPGLVHRPCAAAPLDDAPSDVIDALARKLRSR